MEFFSRIKQRIRLAWILDPTRLDAFHNRVKVSSELSSPKIPVREPGRKFDIKYFVRDSRRSQEPSVRLDRAQIDTKEAVGPVTPGQPVSWKPGGQNTSGYQA
ncbi:mitochondrial Complex I (CI) NADH:ubiquinone oxidoreductase subunit B14.5a/N4AM/NDUFA7 [Andalucia godoyi]|uniref:Mitochondrial Complex I (CI) NADH:ubiquinone oxidoreductase subunit B14.5a/N4AM/NDUFA7 n=1 Tax=Andalucia godoyi TaxID=505711 RepID=A0A8K0F2H0_ANDGO|nr:mitochondrial Complex I (CI) NADH:ubiquinone oxidoreductase subunit B14.5a/N4AM/NDUFA7 [Andalucia godoyi]|eukprot:ANDGO_00786.mRNA.1 mitochondrial Complex I (CI) NADH:ubiquinone oxidoreductase subunit B14.5a/N4AM/NDUFA7